MKIKNNLKIKKDEKKIYLFNSDYSGDILYEFEDTGYHIIDFIILNPNCNVEDISQYIEELYNSKEYSTILNDVREFVKELREEKIVED